MCRISKAKNDKVHSLNGRYIHIYIYERKIGIYVVVATVHKGRLGTIRTAYLYATSMVTTAA